METAQERHRPNSIQLKEPSWIALEPVNHAIFEQLTSFLDDIRSNPDNAVELVQSTTETLISTGTAEPLPDQYRMESRVLFAILLSIVQQLDAAAIEQDHLVDLVLSLRHVPMPKGVCSFEDPRALDENMNHDLKSLINVWSAFERDAPLHPRYDDRPTFIDMQPERPPWRQLRDQYISAQCWASLNAFMAKLHNAAPDILKIDVRGLFAMIEALEQPLSPTQLGDALPIAAYWIIYAGKRLRSNRVPYANVGDDGGSKRMPWSKGELWTGQHAFNDARWDFWMQRFSEISERDDVDMELRTLAKQAVEVGSSLTNTSE